MNKFLGILLFFLIIALVYCGWTIYTQRNKILVLSSNNEKLEQAVQFKEQTIQALSNFSDIKEQLRKDRLEQEQIRKQMTEEILQSVQEVMQNDPEAKSWGDASIPNSWIRMLDDAQYCYGTSGSSCSTGRSSSGPDANAKKKGEY